MKTLEKANGIKRVEDIVCIEAHTRPWLPGLERDPGQDRETRIFCETYLGPRWTLSKSLPVKLF